MTLQRSGRQPPSGMAHAKNCRSRYRRSEYWGVVYRTLGQAALGQVTFLAEDMSQASSAKNAGESQGAWKERDRGDSAETTRLGAAERNSPRLLMLGEIWATGRQSVWARGEDTNLWLPPSCAMSRISTGPVSPLTPFSSVMFPLTAPHVGPRPLSVQVQGCEKSIGPVSPRATVCCHNSNPIDLSGAKLESGRGESGPNALEVNQLSCWCKLAPHHRAAIE